MFLKKTCVKTSIKNGLDFLHVECLLLDYILYFLKKSVMSIKSIR